MSEVISSGDGREAIRRTPVNPIGRPADVNWTAIEGDRDFQGLVREKRNFIIPATIFFLVYYFGFLIIVGYFPALVDVDIIGHINLAYLFALSQFVMAWVIVYLYVRRARTFDRLANAIVAKVKGIRE